MKKNGFDYDEYYNLGNILLRCGKITEDALRRALRVQKKEPTTRLGEILVRMKVCTQEDIDSALEEQVDAREPLKKTGHESGAVQYAELRKAKEAYEESVNRLERRISSTSVFKVSPD